MNSKMKTKMATINAPVETPRPQFTSGHFIDALVEFIVATDQVCLNFNFY